MSDLLSDTDFSSVLRRLRLDAGLTQHELAAQSGVSTAAIRDLEQGRSRAPRRRSLRALATVLARPDVESCSAGPAPVVCVGGSIRSGATAADGPGSTDTAVTDGDCGPASFRLAVFGPLSLRWGEIPVPVGAGRHRLVLGRLALTPNAMVHRDELVDLLWGEEVPPSAVNMVQRYVARLRRMIEPSRGRHRSGAVLALVPGGYRLDVTSDQVDLLEYRDLVARAEVTRRVEDALDLLGRAVSLSRGAPLTDLADLQHHPLVTTIGEQQIDTTIRFAALAERVDRAKLALAPLREVAGRHPLHEPLHARLVATLAAAGLRSQALATYDRICRRLAEELGIGPGGELVSTYRRIARRHRLTA